MRARIDRWGRGGRAGRATASLETYAATIRRGRGRARGGACEDSSVGEDEGVYGMDGDSVPRDAPVVMCVGRRLRDAAEDVRASVEGRRAASRVVVFVGCDEGDEEHAMCARVDGGVRTRARARKSRGGGERRGGGNDGDGERGRRGRRFGLGELGRRGRGRWG